MWQTGAIMIWKKKPTMGVEYDGKSLVEHKKNQYLALKRDLVSNDDDHWMSAACVWSCWACTFLG